MSIHWLRDEFLKQKIEVVVRVVADLTSRSLSFSDVLHDFKLGLAQVRNDL